MNLCSAKSRMFQIDKDKEPTLWPELRLERRHVDFKPLYAYALLELYAARQKAQANIVGKIYIGLAKNLVHILLAPQ